MAEENVEKELTEAEKRRLEQTKRQKEKVEKV